MPADVNFMPLAFDAAQFALAHLAQVAQRRRVANERNHVVPAGRGDFNGGENQFQFLGDDALDLEEMAFVRRIEFFAAGDVDEVIELFPALDVVFNLADQLVEFFGGHRRRSGWRWREGGLRENKNDGAAAQFAGGDAQAGKMNVQFRERHLGRARLVKQFQHVTPDDLQQRPRIRGRDGGGDNLTVAVHRNAARRQLLNCRARSEKFFQESHDAISFLLFSNASPAAAPGGQPTRKAFLSEGNMSNCRSKPLPATCDNGPASMRSPKRLVTSATWRVQSPSCPVDCVPNASGASFSSNGTETTNSAPSRMSRPSFQIVFRWAFCSMDSGSVVLAFSSIVWADSSSSALMGLVMVRSRAGSAGRLSKVPDFHARILRTAASPRAPSVSASINSPS